MKTKNFAYVLTIRKHYCNNTFDSYLVFCPRFESVVDINDLYSYWYDEFEELATLYSSVEELLLAKQHLQANMQRKHSESAFFLHVKHIEFFITEVLVTYKNDRLVNREIISNTAIL